MSTHGRTHWIKLYVEMLDDPKVGLLPDAVKWRWVSVLLLAGELNEDGYLPDANDMAWRLHTNVETLQGEMRTMAGRGLVELRPYQDGSERWFIPAFAKRQAAATGTERSQMSRHRARQGGNGSVTPAQRNVAQSLHKQKQNTEAETEAEGESGAIAPAPAPAPAAIPFQPVPEAVKVHKARRGIVEPEPVVTATAPSFVKLLAQHTGYWPGEDVALLLLERYGSAPPDEKALARAVDLWKLGGHKLTNFGGIADWYDQVRADPEWTPQKRFRNGNGAASGSRPPAQPSTPPVVLKPIAPGVY